MVSHIYKLVTLMKSFSFGGDGGKWGFGGVWVFNREEEANKVEREGTKECLQSMEEESE